MTKSGLVKKLCCAITEDEWGALENYSSGITISGFNRKAILEMKNAAPGSGEVRESDVLKLSELLNEYLTEHMGDKPDGFKWIIISCIYLAFVAEHPMHPVEEAEISVVETEEGTVYICPLKSALKNTVCDFCVCRRMSNYEITKRTMQREFAKYNQEKMISKFALEHDSDYLYINFFSRRYRIGREDGVVRRSCKDGWTEAGFNEAMTIYDVLCCSKDGCAPAGEFENLKSMGSVDGGLFKRDEDMFDGKEKELSRACESMGGEKFGKGDVAYKIPVFDFMYSVFQFWNSDDEFPPNMQLLWDKNILDYMHYETVWYAAGCLIERLREIISG